MRNHLAIMAAAAGLICPGQALAQGEDSATLPEVVVTRSWTSTLPEGDKAASANDIVISRETIQSTTADNLSELLQQMGLATETAPTDYDENVVMLRGFGTEHLNTEVNGNVLIMIDGRRSGIASARQITMDNVERVEIIRGPEMYKYSMGSPGGIINIVTKRGGPKALSGAVKFGIGSYEAYKGGLSLNGLVNNFDYNLGYTYTTTGADYKAGDGKKVANTRTDGTDSMFLNLGYTFNETHRVGIDAYYYKVDRAYRPAYIDDEGDAIPPGYTDRESQLFNINYEGRTDDNRLSWHASLGYGKDESENFTGTAASGSVNPIPKGQWVETKQAQAGVTYRGELFDLSGGLDYVHYDVENSASGSNRYYAGRWPMYRHDTSSSSIFGAYLVGTLKLMEERLNLTGGLRYEHSEAEDKAVGDENFAGYPYFSKQGITDRSQLPTKRSFDHLSPSLGVSYLPVEWLKLRANYTQSWRAPSGRQLFASRHTEGYGAGGDPRLKPEKTNTYEAGFDVNFKHANFSATYFFNDIKDFIYIYFYANPTNANPNGTGRVLRNVDKRYQAGFEFQTSANLAGLMGYDSFELRPYVTLTHMTKREEQIRSGVDGMDGWWWPITRMPDTTMNYGIRFTHFASHFSANLSFNYSGLRIPGRGNASPNEHYRDMEFGKVNVANLSLSKRLWEFENESHLTLKVNVNNIFDKVYSYRDKVPDTYPYAGRNYYATLSYNF